MSRSASFIEIITKAGELRAPHKEKEEREIPNIPNIDMVVRNSSKMIAFNALVESLSYDTGLDIIKLGEAIVHPANLIHFKHFHTLCIKMRNCNTQEGILQIFSNEELGRLSQYAIAVEAGALEKEFSILQRITNNKDCHDLFCRYGELCTVLRNLNNNTGDVHEYIMALLTLDNIITDYLTAYYGFNIADKIPGNWVADDIYANMKQMANNNFSQITAYFRQEMNDSELERFVSILERIVDTLKNMRSDNVQELLRDYVINFLTSYDYISRCHDRVMSIKLVTDSIYERHFSGLTRNDIIDNLCIIDTREMPISYNDYITKYLRIPDVEVGSYIDGCLHISDECTKELIDCVARCNLRDITLLRAEMEYSMNLLKNATLLELGWKIFKLYKEECKRGENPEFDKLIDLYKVSIPTDFSIIPDLQKLLPTIEAFVEEFCKIEDSMPDIKEECKCECDKKDGPIAIDERICEGLQTLSNQFESKCPSVYANIIINALPCNWEFTINAEPETSIYHMSKTLIDEIFRRTTDLSSTLDRIKLLEDRILLLSKDQDFLRNIADIRKALINIRNIIRHNITPQIIVNRCNADVFVVVYLVAMKKYNQTAHNPFFLTMGKCGNGFITDMIREILLFNIDIGIQKSPIYKMCFDLEEDNDLIRSVIKVLTKYIMGLDKFVVENASDIYNESINKINSKK